MTDEKRKKEGFFGEQGRRSFLKKGTSSMLAFFKREGINLKAIGEFVAGKDAHPVATAVNEAANRFFRIHLIELISLPTTLPGINIKEGSESGTLFSTLEEHFTFLHRQTTLLEEALDAIQKDYAANGPTKTLLEKETEFYHELIQKGKALVASTSGVDDSVRVEVKDIARSSTITFYGPDPSDLLEQHKSAEILEGELKPYPKLHQTYVSMKKTMKKRAAAQLEPLYAHYGIDRSSLRAVALGEFQDLNEPGLHTPITMAHKIGHDISFGPDFAKDRIEWIVMEIGMQAVGLITDEQQEELEARLGEIKKAWIEKLTSPQKEPAEQEPVGEHTQRIIDDRERFPWPGQELPGNDVY